MSQDVEYSVNSEDADYEPFEAGDQASTAASLNEELSLEDQPNRHNAPQAAQILSEDLDSLSVDSFSVNQRNPPQNAARFDLDDYKFRLREESFNELLAKAGSKEEMKFLMEHELELRACEALFKDGNMIILEKKIMNGRTIEQLSQEPGANKYFISKNESMLQSCCKQFLVMKSQLDDSQIVTFGEKVKGKSFKEILEDPIRYRSWLRWLKFDSEGCPDKDGNKLKAWIFFSRKYPDWNDIKEMKKRVIRY